MEGGKKIILAILLVVILVSSFYIVGSLKKSKTPAKIPITSGGSSLNVTLDNFEEIVSKNAMIKDLPDNAVIKLSFYEGDREESFIIRKGSVKKGNAENPDLNISLPLSYMDGLTDRNFCDVIKKAKNDGFLFVSTDKAKTSLLWKYKSMTGYRDCLGF